MTDEAGGMLSDEQIDRFFALHRGNHPPYTEELRLLCRQAKLALTLRGEVEGLRNELLIRDSYVESAVKDGQILLGMVDCSTEFREMMAARFAVHSAATKGGGG